jgi:hypothetical protein
MDLSLRHHINVHLRNPQNNYIILENCKHCKLDRRISYGSNLKKPKNYHNNFRLPINFNSIYRLINFNIPTNLPIYIPPNEDNTDYESDSTVYGFPDYMEEEKTNLSLVNRNSSVSIYLRGINPLERCVICYDYLKSFQVVRTLVCQHHFHQKCLDKWLETRKTCPTCRFDLLE